MSNIGLRPETRTEIRQDFKTEYVKEHVNLIQNKISKLKHENSEISIFEIEMRISDEFSDFFKSYPSLLKKICSGDDLTTLYKMLDCLYKVDKKEDTFGNIEKKLSLELGKQYLGNFYKK